MKREYHRWHSPSLGRTMELLAFGHDGQQVLVFPTRCAHFHEYEDNGLVGALRERIERGELRLVCVDSVDSEAFYSTTHAPPQRVHRHERYEAYLMREVLPFLDARDPQHHGVVAHGCSFGAFHAVNLALRHPWAFRRVVALSGRYDLTLAVEGFRNLLDGHYDDGVYFHTPSHFLPNLDDPWLLGQLRRLHVVLAVGREDPFLDNNFRMRDALARKGISHELHLWDGRAHCPRVWRQMVPCYL